MSRIESLILRFRDPEWNSYEASFSMGRKACFYAAIHIISGYRIGKSCRDIGATSFDPAAVIAERNMNSLQIAY